MDCADRGNIATRLVHATNEAAAMQRFAGIDCAGSKDLPHGEIALSAAEIHSAGASWSLPAGGWGAFRNRSAAGKRLCLELALPSRYWRNGTQPRFVDLANVLRETRHPYGPRQHPLWRMHPERWLESLVVGDVSMIDDRLQACCRIFSGSGVFSGRSSHG